MRDFSLTLKGSNILLEMKFIQSLGEHKSRCIAELIFIIH